jgi:trehalose 6-phosphate synthase/phosphatase
MSSSDAARLIVASNRLPVVVKRGADGNWTLVPGMGGLVTALGPVLQGRGGIWVGWPGSVEPEAVKVLEESRETGYTLRPVLLTEQEVHDYYQGFSNEVLWPLFHDLSTRCNFDPKYWPVYEQVNRKFAEAIADVTAEQDFIWVQDYHLLFCAAMLREMGLRNRIGYFLHIPFPPLDLFLKLPWRFQLLQALLQFDLVGFQTPRDRRNFFQCVRAIVPNARVTGGGKSVVTLTAGERELRVGSFPIGIDSESFGREASSAAVTRKVASIREQIPRQQLMLGVDRLDYTKGIPERLRAVGNALERYPELRGNITFIQQVVPSRVKVPEYQTLKGEIERLVGEINGRFTTSGWAPIQYIYRVLSRTELLAHYRTSDIALITPLKDGMNLVAKEYCACSVEHGVLLLSEFAGSAGQLHKHALMVNPHDIEGVADAIYRAYKMPLKEKQSRMRALRRQVQRQDVFWWVREFLNAAFAEDLASGFTHQPLFVPQPDASEILPDVTPLWSRDHDTASDGGVY